MLVKLNFLWIQYVVTAPVVSFACSSQVCFYNDSCHMFLKYFRISETFKNNYYHHLFVIYSTFYFGFEKFTFSVGNNPHPTLGVEIAGGEKIPVASLRLAICGHFFSHEEKKRKEMQKQLSTTLIRKKQDVCCWKSLFSCS